MSYPIENSKPVTQDTIRLLKKEAIHCGTFRFFGVDFTVKSIGSKVISELVSVFFKSTLLISVFWELYLASTSHTWQTYLIF